MGVPMAFLSTLVLALSSVAVHALPTVVERASGPTVTLGGGATFTGVSSGNVQKFLGIPFAQPP